MGNFESFPKSMLGESIPTKLVFFKTKYFPAENANPGLFLNIHNHCSMAKKLLFDDVKLKK